MAAKNSSLQQSKFQYPFMTKASECLADAAPAASPLKSTKPKKSAAAKPKKPAAPADHPKYNVMIAAAVSALKERGGSSRQAILKYIMANYNVGTETTKINARLKTALKAGVKAGSLKQAKGTGASGSFRLGEKKVEKPKVKAAKPKAAAKPKKAAAKKPKATGAKPKSLKKAAAAKKPKASGEKKTKAAKPKKPKTLKAAKSPAKKAAKPKVAKKPKTPTKVKPKKAAPKKAAKAE